jgi:hypothetical protein
MRCKLVTVGGDQLVKLLLILARHQADQPKLGGLTMHRNRKTAVEPVVAGFVHDQCLGAAELPAVAELAPLHRGHAAQGFSDDRIAAIVFALEIAPLPAVGKGGQDVWRGVVAKLRKMHAAVHESAETKPLDGGREGASQSLDAGHAPHRFDELVYAPGHGRTA